ncbi:MAG: DUF3500 domain-containing protein [Xanthobacteraceae bacterium]
MSRADFRPFVPAPGQSRIAGPTPREHTQARIKSPRAGELFGAWEKLAAAPFKGITTNGTVEDGLFSLAPADAPTPEMVAAAEALLRHLSPAQRGNMSFPVDSRVWRQWQNTELYVEHHGLRLDEVAQPIRDAAMAVLRASLSAKGFQVSRAVMQLNRFLGDLVGGPEVLGEWAYTFCLFGTPSPSEPWGWQLFGHHLSLNCLVIGRQMVLSPTFLGAEPAYADSGPFAGTTLFEDEERSGLALMRSLSPQQQKVALVSSSMHGADHPPGRWHFADHLHLGGAHQDNRIVPLEGLRGSGLSALQRRNLTDLISAYLQPLPSGPQAARMSEIERHLEATHFCWIGGFDEVSPFYYRVQSPVVFIEFDHHSGVFLTNKEPAKFHVHTVVRTPNGNDYGFDVLRQHYAQSHARRE